MNTWLQFQQALTPIGLILRRRVSAVSKDEACAQASRNKSYTIPSAAISTRRCACPVLLRVLSSLPRHNFVRDMAGNSLAQ
uniref:Uncharacterized protein n=1 Tax=Bradyrhizobium amphicarpaeae TaxID=1404768 RepID=A0A2U8PTF5_9BRAD|nr:hypothetical protein CIT40_13945 [Bradyrhizobium amphicarpaeae]